ncbi:hypothetical protein EON82_18295 [bacterium]|nr:MAG: hypothetical protein EON82_18295 [bacterium]
MNAYARMALSAVFVVGSAFAVAQSRPHSRRNCPPLDPAVFQEPKPDPSHAPYAGGGALAVGALGIASRLRRGLR